MKPARRLALILLLAAALALTGCGSKSASTSTQTGASTTGTTNTISHAKTKFVFRAGLAAASIKSGHPDASSITAEQFVGRLDRAAGSKRGAAGKGPAPVASDGRVGTSNTKRKEQRSGGGHRDPGQQQSGGGGYGDPAQQESGGA